MKFKVGDVVITNGNWTTINTVVGVERKGSTNGYRLKHIKGHIFWFRAAYLDPRSKKLTKAQALIYG